jgi:hypothetical protein
MIGSPEHEGVLAEWTLVLHGTQESPEWLEHYMAEMNVNDNEVLDDEEDEEVGNVSNEGQAETTELENVKDLQAVVGTVEEVGGDDDEEEEEEEEEVEEEDYSKVPESFVEYYNEYMGSLDYDDAQSEMTSERYLAQSIDKFIQKEHTKGRMNGETAEKILNKMAQEQVSKDDIEKQLGKVIQYAMNSKSRKPGKYW